MYDFDKLYDRQAYDAIKYLPQKPEHNGCMPFWIADMDFPVAKEIEEALIARMNFPVYGYTQRTNAYYQAITDWMSRRHNWHIDPGSISTNPGVVPTMAFAFRTFCRDGDKAIIQPPIYPPFAKMIRSSGGRVVENPLHLINGNYEIDFDDFARKAADPDVKMFFLCNPHNPVGRVWRREELRRLAEICLENNVLIYSDDIHHDLTFDGFSYTPIASLSKEISQIVITATAPSKTFNLAGFKMGNIVIENPQLCQQYKAYVEGVWCQHLDISAIVATIAAYNHGEQWLKQALSYIQDNAKFVDDFIKQHLPQLKTYPQQATYLKWIDCRGLGLTNSALENFMLSKAKIWLNEGYTFGTGGDGFERLNFAVPRSKLEQGLTLIKDAVNHSL
jgi:cystathionine beta-lyase